jgi:S-adenosylmethionine decarboxylase
VSEPLDCVGTHLVVDLWGGSDLDDLERMRGTLLACVAACGATLRELDLFRFSEGGGIAGVAMLTQSHISVHTWPEHAYGAFDAYVCGGADPRRILPVLEDAFRPSSMDVAARTRGVPP